jgi:hypothetical protein
MCLSVFSALEHGGTKVLVELGVDHTWAFALDSICLGLLISVILLRRDARLAPTGLAIAVLSPTSAVRDVFGSGSLRLR